MSRLSAGPVTSPQGLSQQPQQSQAASPPVEETMKRLEQSLGQVVQSSQQNNLAAQLAMDPEISQILRARQSGQKVQVVLGEPQAPQEPELNWAEMDEKTRAETLLKKVDQLAEEKAQKLLQPFQQKLQQLEQRNQVQDQQKSLDQLAQCKSAHPDYDEVLPTMQQLAAKGVIGQGATAEQIYRLACQELGRSPTFAQQVNSERPTHSQARPPIGTVMKTPPPPTRSGWQQLLEMSAKRSTYQEAPIEDYESPLPPD